MVWTFLPHGLVDSMAGQFSGQGGTLKSGIEWPSMCKIYGYGLVIGFSLVELKDVEGYSCWF